MIIGVDETGSFKDNQTEQFGLVTLVSVTDSEWKNFQEFINTNFPTAFNNTKGSNIPFPDREKILKYIGHHPEIKYTTIIYDLNYGQQAVVEAHKINQIVKIQNWIIENLTNAYLSLIEDLELLRNQIGNLSSTDYSKFFFITELFIEWQQYFLFDYVYTHISRDSWKMEHVVDTQVKPDKFKRMVNATMHLTANNYNPNFSVKTPKEWEDTHPFLVNHSVDGTRDFQDGKKLFENFKIGTEQTDHILFIPDLIGNTVFNSILHADSVSWLKILARLKQNRSITMTKNGKKNNYYLISGFSGSDPSVSTNQIFQKHFDKMKLY